MLKTIPAQIPKQSFDKIMRTLQGKRLKEEPAFVAKTRERYWSAMIVFLVGLVALPVENYGEKIFQMGTVAALLNFAAGAYDSFFIRYAQWNEQDHWVKKAQQDKGQWFLKSMTDEQLQKFARELKFDAGLSEQFFEVQKEYDAGRLSVDHARTALLSIIQMKLARSQGL